MSLFSGPLFPGWSLFCKYGDIQTVLGAAGGSFGSEKLLYSDNVHCNLAVGGF